MNTRELLDEYFTNERPDLTAAKIRGQIDREELYTYEKKIGKQLVDMDSMEIFELIKSIIVKDGKTYTIPYRTYDIILVIIRDFFNWYIRNYKVIINPCYDKRIRGKNAVKLFECQSEVFTKETLETIIETIREKQPVEEYADYHECVLRMFYEGFADPQDIVNMKELVGNMVTVNGKQRILSDRLVYLLNKIHNMETYPAYRGKYVMISYHGSYMKFPTRVQYKDNERDVYHWAAHINRLINREIRAKYKLNINARLLYLRGFYDWCCESIGKASLDDIINGKAKDKYYILANLANEYGINEKNISAIRKMLSDFAK